MSTHRVSTPQGALAVDQHGAQGQPMLCVPGLGDLRSSWRAFAPKMAGQGYVVYVMDLRGHGDSDTTFDSYTTEDIGEDVLAVLEHFELRDAIIVGNSIGGGAAVHAALSSPERIEQLVLVNPFVRDPPNFAVLRLMMTVIFAWPWGRWAWAWYRSTLFKTVPPDHAQHHQAVMDNLSEPGRFAATKAMIRASKAALGARVDQLTVPSLVIIGTEDPDYPDPAAEGESLQALLGGEVTVHMVEGTGHYTQIERPDETVRIVLEELGRGAARGA